MYGALEDQEVVEMVKKQIKRDPTEAEASLLVEYAPLTPWLNFFTAAPMEVAKVLQAVDRDHDGKVTLDEYLTYLFGEGWKVVAERSVSGPLAPRVPCHARVPGAAW